MHITVEPSGGDHAFLHLRGDFDTFYVTSLQQELDQLQKAGIRKVALNLRLVRFINSTAIGALIKASKQLSAAGGKLVIARPSPFCRDIFSKVGLDRVIKVYESEEDAVAALHGGTVATAAKAVATHDEESSVLFSPQDMDRIKVILSQSTIKAPVTGAEGWSGAGRMGNVDEQGLSFTWNGGDTGLAPFSMAQVLAMGTRWKLQFRLPMLQKGFLKAQGVVSEISERTDGVKVSLRFQDLEEATAKALKQYAEDMRNLKKELG